MPHDTPGDARGEQVAAVGHGVHGCAKVGGGKVLGQITGRSETDTLENVLFLVEGREDDHARGLESGVGADATSGVDAVGAGHTDVHEHHIWFVLPCLGYRFFSGGGLGNDLDGRVRPEQGTQSSTYKVLVVGDQYPNHVDSSQGILARTAKPPSSDCAAVNVPPRALMRSPMPAIP